MEMESYEYKDVGGRVLCKQHHMLRCSECDYVDELKDKNKQYLEGVFSLYKSLCVGGKYDKRVPGGAAYNLILDIEKIADSDSELRDRIDAFLKSR